MPQGYSEATPVRDSGCVPESQELRKLQESFDAQTTAIDAIDAIRRALNNLDDTAARIYKKYLERQG
jgi:soluble cytochrome b562